jgi:hypothetical protein
VQCLLKALTDRFLKAKEHTPYTAQHQRGITFTDEALITVNRSRDYITIQAQVKLFCIVIKPPHGHLQDLLHELKQKCAVLPFLLSDATGRFMELTTPFHIYARNCEFTAHGTIKIYQRPFGRIT